MVTNFFSEKFQFPVLCCQRYRAKIVEDDQIMTSFTKIMNQTSNLILLVSEIGFTFGQVNVYNQLSVFSR